MPLWARSSEPDRSSLRQAYKSLNKSVVIVGVPGVGHGTAFVISRKNRLLATNAHVADIMESQNQLLAIANNSSERIKVAAGGITQHPEDSRRKDIIRSANPADGDVYPICPDVAVLHVEDDGTELPDEVDYRSGTNTAT